VLSDVGFASVASIRRQYWGEGRGAVGAENETPQALSEMENGEPRGIPSPAKYEVWGSVVSSQSGVRGGAATEDKYGAFSHSQNTSSGTIA